MEFIRRKIYDSFIYNFILKIIYACSFSYIMKPSKHKYKKYAKTYHESIIVRILSPINKSLDKKYNDIRTSCENSKFIKLLHKIYVNITTQSIIGRLTKEFNFAYIIAMYIFIDTLIRSRLPSVASIWDEALFIIIIIWLICRRIFCNKKYKSSSIDYGLLFFAIVYLILAFVNSPDMNIAIEGYRAVVQHMLWFFLMVQLLDTKKVINRTVWIFIIGIGLIGVHGIYQYITKAPMLGNWVDSAETITTRVYSITKSPNALGSLLVLFIPIAFSMIFANEDIIKKIIAAFFTITMCMSILFTYSRGAWFGVFIAILIFLLFMNKRLIFLVVTAILLLLINIDALWNRISYLFTPEYTNKSMNGGRLYRYYTSIKMWSESKFLGLGIGRYGGAVATNHNLTPFYMDSYYLKTLTESGIIGFGSFVILILSTIYKLYRYIMGTTIRKDKIIMYGIFSGLCGVLIQNFVENIFELPFMVVYFWALVAVIVALFNCNERHNN
ncbi:O-antigen ligase family protein [Vallitalea guaymasensis]|uniref:O-antigen ligase family protein n=1 Tax=Vallitalea guaymasensis TaxID=1185412 RepID=UPI002729991B|nr:O-antigen ligase family protein [Vallitalea guaymasensis]